MARRDLVSMVSLTPGHPLERRAPEEIPQVKCVSHPLVSIYHDKAGKRPSSEVVNLGERIFAG